MYERYNPAVYRRGWAFSTQEIYRMHGGWPDGVLMICKSLPESGNTVVFAIVHEPLFSVHPVAVYGPRGEYLRIPIHGLRPGTDNRFVYEVDADRPLRAADDARSLAERWARSHADVPFRG